MHDPEPKIRAARSRRPFGSDHAAKNKALEQDQFILLQLPTAFQVAFTGLNTASRESQTPQNLCRAFNGAARLRSAFRCVRVALAGPLWAVSRRTLSYRKARQLCCLF